LENNQEIRKVELTNETGENLIASALSYPSKEGWDIARIVFPDIGEYTPPQVEEPSEDSEQ
jgi:hypothetical protein